MNFDEIRELTRRKDVDYLEMRLEESFETKIQINGREVETVSQGKVSGGSVRALVSGVWGFVYFNETEDLKERVKSAIEQAKTLSVASSERVELASVEPIEIVEEFKPLKDPQGISISDKIKLFSHYSEIPFSIDNRIANVRVAYSEKRRKLAYANSEGTFIQRELMDMGGGIIPIASNGKEIHQTHVPFGSAVDFSVAEDLEGKINEKTLLAVNLLSAEDFEGGEFPVIIDQDLGGVFIHEAFGHLSEADFISEDEKMKEIMKIGKLFGSEIINVYDVGNIFGVRGSLTVDDEGVPAETVALIKEGVLSGHLHTRETAAKMKEAPTGNGRAISFKYPPIPRMRTTYIAPQDAKFEDFIKDIKFGVYAKSSFGGQTNGELFTFVPESAYLIEGGKVTRLIKNVSLSGNVFETLKNIVGIADDFRITDGGGGCGKGEQHPLPVSTGSPHIYISKAIIGGKK